MTLPCLVCGKPLEPAIADNEHNQPYAATCFQAHGQYGSTVWDPPISVSISGLQRYLEVNICDDCLVAHANRVNRVEVVPRRAEVTETPWNPGED